MNQAALLALLVLMPSPVAEWELKKDKDGIAVYTRQLAGSELEEFKAVITLKNTTLLKVLGVITDVPGYVGLFPNCSEAKVLERTDRYNTVHYMVTDAPFPVGDQDGVYQQRTTIVANGTKARVELSVLPKRLPVKEGLVRVPGGSGHWELEQLGTTVLVSYQFHGEPGGAVPSWLANSFIVDHPFETMKNLRSRVAG
jgi:hypothetical protein